MTEALRRVAAISQSLPPVHPMEVLAAVACRVVCTLPHPPEPFSVLVIQPTNATKLEYEMEIRTLIRSFPKTEGTLNSETLKIIRTHLEHNTPEFVGNEAAYFYLAVVGSPALFMDWTSKVIGRLPYFHQMQRKVRENPAQTGRTMAIIIRHLIEFGMTNRYLVTRNLILSAPSFAHNIRVEIMSWFFLVILVSNGEMYISNA